MSIITTAPLARRSAEAGRLGTRFAAVLAVLVLFGAAASASSAAEWTAPLQVRSLPGVPPYAVSPQVGVDADGDAVFVWISSDSSGCYMDMGCQRVQARVRSADGTLGPVEMLSPPGLNASGAHLAVSPSGAAVVTWEVVSTCAGQYCEIGQARTRSPTGELGAIKTITRDDLFERASVAIDASGDAPIAWIGSDGRVRTRTVTAAGPLTSVRVLSAVDRFATDPQIAVDPGGDAVFAWVIHAARGGRMGFVQSRSKPAGGTLSSIQRISGAGRVFYPRVAVDDGGNAAFSWMQPDPTDCTLRHDQCNVVLGRIRSSSGTLGEADTLSDPGPHAAADEATVGMDNQGDAIFAWLVRGQTSECAGPSCVQTRSIAATGDVEPLHIVVGEDGFIFQRHLQLGVDRLGNAVFSWVRGNPGCTDFADCGRLQTATRSPSGDQTAIETLSPGNEEADYPALAVSPRGQAVVLWVGTENQEDSAIEAAARPGRPSF